jgi:MinD superfamily P-loop ATPase
VVKAEPVRQVIVASLAALVDNKVIVDCNVDAADLHLLLRPGSESETAIKFCNDNNPKVIHSVCVMMN